jgi:hypothetical protein
MVQPHKMSCTIAPYLCLIAEVASPPNALCSDVTVSQSAGPRWRECQQSKDLGMKSGLEMLCLMDSPSKHRPRLLC